MRKYELMVVFPIEEDQFKPGIEAVKKPWLISARRSQEKIPMEIGILPMKSREEPEGGMFCLPSTHPPRRSLKWIGSLS